MKSRVLVRDRASRSRCSRSLRHSRQNADALKKAQASFDQAQNDYLAGKFDEAAQEFQDAYAARPFPQFLYNVGAAYHMKGKKTSDVDAYEKAVEFYKKYLAEEPQAADKAKVEKAIGVLEAEIKRLKDAPAGAGSGSGSAAPPGAVAGGRSTLGDVKVRGLVVIESEPQNATIYLDDKQEGRVRDDAVVGLARGRAQDHHREARLQARRDDDLGGSDEARSSRARRWRRRATSAGSTITSNVAGRRRVHRRQERRRGRQDAVPQNIKPGKHTFWISAEGYDEYTDDDRRRARRDHARSRRRSRARRSASSTSTGLGIEDSHDLRRRQGAVRARPVPARASPRAITRSRSRAPATSRTAKRITIQAKTETQRQGHARADAGPRRRGRRVRRSRARVRRRRHLPRPAGEQPPRRSQEGDRGRHRRRPTPTTRGS